jgi:hypothetical protein
LPGFEEQGCSTGIDEHARSQFDYRGIYRDVIGTITLADVEWACSLLSRLSDEQWNDAFRAGGYNPDETRRYVAKIKTKIT